MAFEIELKRPSTLEEWQTARALLEMVEKGADVKITRTERLVLTPHQSQQMHAIIRAGGTVSHNGLPIGLSTGPPVGYSEKTQRCACCAVL